MVIVQYVVISIFFLLELSMLASFMYWGFYVGKVLLLKILLGVGIPILVAIFWGTFISPKASIPVSIPVRILLQIILFGLSVVALYFSDKRMLSTIFLIVAVIEMLLMYTMKL